MTATMLAAPTVPTASIPVLRTVARRAVSTPDQVAVDDGGYLSTYAELWHAAARTRRDLVEAGVEPGDVVGVDAPPGAGLVAAVLGVWLAGAAYLPVTGHPARITPRATIAAPGATIAAPGATIAAPGATPVPGPPVIPLVEVVAPPTDPPYAPVPPGDAIACVIHAPSTPGLRLSHDDLSALVASCAESSPTAGEPLVLRLFAPLAVGRRLTLARPAPAV